MLMLSSGGKRFSSKCLQCVITSPTPCTMKWGKEMWKINFRFKSVVLATLLKKSNKMPHQGTWNILMQENQIYYFTFSLSFVYSIIFRLIAYIVNFNEMPLAEAVATHFLQLNTDHGCGNDRSFHYTSLGRTVFCTLSNILLKSWKLDFSCFIYMTNRLPIVLKLPSMFIDVLLIHYYKRSS